MRGLPFLLVAMTVALAGLAPLAQAQPPPDHARTTTLYLHALGFEDLPMTTRMPSGSFSRDVSTGIATGSLSCFPNPPVLGTPFQAYHTWRGFGFQGRVDYDEAHPRLVFPGGYGPPANGLDINLTGGPMVLHWSWSTDLDGSSGSGSTPAPLPLAGLVVEATLRTGQATSVDSTSWDEGALIAQGRSGPAVLAGEQSTGVAYSRVGDRDVYDFTIPLDVALPADSRDPMPRLPAAEGFNLRVDTYLVGEQCPAEGYLTPNVLALHTSADHRPRLEFTALDAPRILSMHVGPLADATPGRMVLAATVASPWGDPDLADVRLAVRSLDDPEVSATVLLPFETQPQEHCHCPAKPAERVWLWDAAADRSPPGRYVATVTATSVQGETTVIEHEFALAGAQEAPAVPVGLLALGLASMAVLARWRRRA